MPKKGKAVEEKKDGGKPSCPACGEPLAAGASYCNANCEVKHLKAQMAEKDEKLARYASRGNKGPVKCYGRVNWSTCIQELYSKASFDAKRRTQELRKLGFDCWAHVLDRMPVSNGDGKTSEVKISVVTCALKLDGGKLVAPPDPPFVEGLGAKATPAPASTTK